MKKRLQLKLLMLMALKQTEKDRLHRLWLLLYSLFTEHYAKTQQAQKFVYFIYIFFLQSHTRYPTCRLKRSFRIKWTVMK